MVSALQNIPIPSVVHEPSGLESFEPGGASSPSRLESLGIHLLAARTGVDEPTRAPWRLDSRLEPLGGFLAVSWRLESRSGLGSSLESRGAMRRAGSSLGLDSARAGS